MLSVEEIFKEYYPQLVYFARTKVGDIELAEDLVQDAFVQLINNKGIDSLEASHLAIRNFLYTSVKYAVLNNARKQKIHENYISRSIFSLYDDTDLETDIIKMETYFKLYKALSKLPTSCQNVVRYSYIEELSNKEIAEKLGISIETVKSHKKRGVKILISNIDIFICLFIFKFL